MKTHCRLKIGFFAALFILCLCIYSPHYFPPLFISVAIHESGHIIFARLRHITLSELRLGIFGASLTPCDPLYSYADEIILCIGGPLFNLLSALAALFLLKLPPTHTFIMSSFSLGLLNLLPVSGFDGGRIFLSVMSIIFPCRVAGGIMKILSFLILFALWSFSLYLLLRTASSLTLFVFCSAVFVKIFLPDSV